MPDGVLISVYDLAEKVNMSPRTILQYIYKSEELKKYKVKIKGINFFGNEKTIEEFNKRNKRGKK